MNKLILLIVFVAPLIAQDFQTIAEARIKSLQSQNDALRDEIREYEKDIDYYRRAGKKPDRNDVLGVYDNLAEIQRNLRAIEDLQRNPGYVTNAFPRFYGSSSIFVPDDAPAEIDKRDISRTFNVPLPNGSNITVLVSRVFVHGTNAPAKPPEPPPVITERKWQTVKMPRRIATTATSVPRQAYRATNATIVIFPE